MLKEKDSSTWGATFANQNMDKIKLIIALHEKPWLDAKDYKSLSHFELSDEHKIKTQIQPLRLVQHQAYKRFFLFHL